MADLINEMWRRELAKTNEAGRGNHNAGMFSRNGYSLTSSDRIISGSSSKKHSSGRYLGNGQYVED